MIADIERARQLALNEQRLVRRHINMALATALVHSAMCAFYFWGGYFVAPLSTLLTMLAVIWIGNIVFLTLIHRGITERLKDPSLSLWVALWLTTGFLVSCYFVDTFRISILMIFFATMLLASFRLSFGWLFLLASYASAGYALVLTFAFMDRGVTLSPTVEILQWLIFVMTAIAFCITGSGINALRRSLSGKNDELGTALEQVREMAIRDELTGLFNRRHIMEILQQQQALADSGDYRFCLCYLDLDHFKPINDTYGHGVGDLVLRRFATLVHESLREADYTGRLGGEEFVLVLSQTGLDEAWHVSERLRQRLAEQSFADLHEDLRVTVSIGVAEYRIGESIDDTLARADGCLYQAKETGRNRVLCETHLSRAANG